MLECDRLVADMIVRVGSPHWLRAFVRADHPRDVVDYFAALDAASPDGLPQSVLDFRAAVESTLGARQAERAEPTSEVNCRTIALDLESVTLPVRVFEPPSPVGLCVHFHGGGWTVGSHLQQDDALARLSRESNLTVASVGYRLAPEFQYPVPVNDCEQAIRKLSQLNAGLPLVVAGESAGATLALSAVLRLLRSEGALSVRALDLCYGAFDLRLTPSMRAATSRGFNRDLLEWFVDQYVPASVDRSDADVSPLFAELGGLPPVHLTVGTADPLIDDSLFLHSRLLNAGVKSELDLVPGAGHAILTIPLTIAGQVIDSSAEFLRLAVA